MADVSVKIEEIQALLDSPGWAYISAEIDRRIKRLLSELIASPLEEVLAIRAQIKALQTVQRLPKAILLEADSAKAETRTRQPQF